MGNAAHAKGIEMYVRCQSHVDKKPRRSSDAPTTPTVLTQEAAAIPLPPTPSTARISALYPQQPLPERPRSRSPAVGKDFSFVLRPQNFHVIPRTDVSSPFVSPLPSAEAPLALVLRQGHHLTAATVAAQTLTSAPSLQPQEIFSLLYTRLACLTITGHDEMAAQESLILGDIHSPFYFTKDGNGREACILPWALRLLAARLQAVAAKDPKRAVQGYYDLAAYARKQHKLSVTADDKDLWQRRLRDLGLRTGNTLIAMGDMNGARRLYKSFVDAAEEQKERAVLAGWLAMLCLRMGDLEGARQWIVCTAEEKDRVLDALLMMTEDRYDNAVTAWRELLEGEQHVLAKHNLAVCLVYTGELTEATKILEGMIDAGYTFHALTFNLATLYELRTEHARERKMALAERVAGELRGNEERTGKNVERRMEDFKILESLQSWIARNSSIESKDQILMTARGKQVRLQTLSLETEIFVYNRQILSASAQASLSSSLPTTPAPDPYRSKAAPDGPHNKNDPEAWQQLFKARKAWAVELRDRCLEIASQIRQLGSEADVIQRSAAIAVENIKQHIGNLRPKFEDSRIWADNVLQDQSFLLEEWERIVDKYPSILTIKALGACLSGTPAISQDTSQSSASECKTSLYDFVSIAEVTKASNAGKASFQRFKSRATDVDVAFSDVEQKADIIVENFNRDANLSDSSAVEQSDHLLEEVEVMTNKIKSDHDHVLGLSQASNAITQMTRIALLHTRSFIPTLLQTASELDHLLRKTVERKNEAQTSGVQYLQNISSVESRIAMVHAKLAKLDIDPEDGQAFEALGAATRLPSVYGLLLVECVRRLEWTDRITVDSSSLVEEVATSKDEEIKRRKKWITDMEGAVDLGPLDDMSVNIDVNVHAEKQKWPRAGREDIHAYIGALQESQVFEYAIKEVETALSTLDAPTRQQSRRAKAFKNGSIHDTAFGKNSLLLRRDEDLIHALVADKSKLEDKLKSSDSRIRKLEDLLHRQSHVSRPSSSSGNPFSVQAPRGSSPVIGFTPSAARPQDPASRRSSISSRRISIHTEPDEKSLGKRIVSLEAELLAEKAQSAGLQKDATARLNAEDNLKAQIQEATSVKEDLLGNFEAQQREFEDERRLFEDENTKLKTRLEEAEDELDRIIGSRDREARTRATEEETQRLRDDAEQAVREANRQTDFYEAECETLREANSRLQQQHTELQARHDRHLAQLQDQEAAYAEYRSTLQSAVEHMEPNFKLPSDLKASVQAVEAATRKHRVNLNELRQLLDKTKTENEEVESRSKDQHVEMQDLRDRLGNEEMESLSTRQSLAENREELKRVRNELDKERMDHNRLKDDNQAIETHADALQARITGLNRKIGSLHADLEKAQKESRSFHSQLQNNHHLSSERLAQRAARAGAVSQRLYAQISRLEKLLEHVGYTVNRQRDNPMTVQKIAKAPGTSTLLSFSGPLPIKTASEHLPEPDYLFWATSDNPETEGQLYGQFDEDLSTFDINVFQEAIIRRIKDAEHLARKWQREARGYRDKFHRAQTEAHEKIAFRSFKEGDLALFLPTRNQATRPWAAFNVGAPHYFLREQDSHRLRSRDWLLARISKVEERVVDLSKSINGVNGASDRPSTGDASDGASLEDENPFELSDGLRWYLLDAAEEKPGAPINVGLGKATVASASVDAQGSSIRPSKKPDGKDGATKTLTRSLDSRRNSTNSKKNQPVVPASTLVQPGNAGEADANDEAAVKDAAKEDTPANNEGHESKDEGGDVVQEQPKATQSQVSPTKSTSDPRGSSGRQSLLRQASSSPHKKSPQKGQSPEKPTSRAWNSLWSLDLNLESGKEKK
ncbi:MAG: hypothetical protein LQ338_003714 [Usnochroma carphineum]|nr:MAG: hypothetical protein LQ338_003714 [Usnochroma carphineum]